mgnify:FL=1
MWTVDSMIKKNVSCASSQEIFMKITQKSISSIGIATIGTRVFAFWYQRTLHLNSNLNVIGISIFSELSSTVYEFLFSLLLSF